MRIRSSATRISELTKWIKKNKEAKKNDFIRKTGGTHHQYYYIRSVLKLSKKRADKPDAMNAVANNKPLDPKPVDKILGAAGAPDLVKAMQLDNEKLLAEPRANEVLVEGVAPDFIWYEMDLMQRKLSDVSVRLNHVMKVAQARDGDQKKMMRDLISENSTLRVENNGLRQQVTELTEMINGAPV